MSDPLRIALVGATGLIGRAIIRQCVGRDDVRIVAIVRREMKLPAGARMEMVVADPSGWGDVFERTKPDVLISALGTTWKKSGKDEAAFRAVDHDLVLSAAQSAFGAGVRHLITVSSAMADARSNNFYLRVKGEAEQDLAKIGFDRFDILRSGLLRGKREADRRLGERMGIILSPVTDLLLHGKYRKFRSISDVDLANAALALAKRKAAGKFYYEHDALIRAAHSQPPPKD